VASLGRVEFRPGRFILAADLAAGEADRRYRLHLHQALQHGPGILRGLALEIAGGRIQVTPGLALDAYGRPLWLADRTTIEHPVERGAAVDVWLVWAETPAVPTRRGRVEVCTGHWGRTRETAAVEVTPRGSLAVPIAVGEDCDGEAFPPPFEPADPAGVYLGSVRDADGLRVDRTGVRYASAKGEAVVSGSGALAVLLGYEPAAVTPRFTVTAGDTKPVLAVDLDGMATVRGRISAERAEASRVRFGRAGPPADRPRPWSIARVAVPREQGPPLDVLRLEIENLGGTDDPALRRFALGKDGGASPLVVAANGNVMVSRLDASERIHAPISADPNDPRFAAAAADALLAGIAAALARSFVQGSVVDVQGLPVAGASVELIGLAPEQHVDNQGRFVFPRVGWPGQVAFARATAPGRKPRVAAGVVGSTLQIALEVSP
jgi:hypothetical protein